jgi:GT2 family glycosyltransferase
MGWAAGNNLGIRLAIESGARYVVLLNNDTVVADNLVERLVAAAGSNPEFGVVGPIINDLLDPGRVQTEGCRFNDTNGKGFFQRQVVPIVTTDPPTVCETDIVNGCCLMLSERLVHSIGLIEEDFFLIHEESDFCLRARRAGFRCGIVSEPLVWHRQSQSFERVGLRVQRYYDTRNLNLLLKRHLNDHDRGRTRWRSWMEYYKYAYYRFCIEQEAGHVDAANAVVEGVCDAWSQSFGRWEDRPRWCVRILRFAFQTARFIRLCTARISVRLTEVL